MVSEQERGELTLVFFLGFVDFGEHLEGGLWVDADFSRQLCRAHPLVDQVLNLTQLLAVRDLELEQISLAEWLLCTKNVSDEEGRG